MSPLNDMGYNIRTGTTMQTDNQVVHHTLQAYSLHLSYSQQRMEDSKIFASPVLPPPPSTLLQHIPIMHLHLDQGGNPFDLDKHANVGSHAATEGGDVGAE